MDPLPRVMEVVEGVLLRGEHEAMGEGGAGKGGALLGR